MSCASPSVPLRRPLRRWLAQEISGLRHAVAAATARYHTDRYRKHFTTWQHVCFLVGHGVTHSASLRASYRSFRDLDAFAVQSGMLDLRDDERLTVSYPQLATSNTTRPAAVVGELLPPLIARASGILRAPGVPQDLHLLDATYLPLSLLHAPWLTLERGVQLQVLYHPSSSVPERVLVPTDPRRNDYQGMDDLVLADASLMEDLVGQTVVVDRGYYSTVRFRQLQDAGIHVITRRHPQAHVAVEDGYPVQVPLALPGSRITVQADQRITLGHPTHRKIAPLPNWRQVTAEVQPTAKAAKRGAQPVVYQILTDRWDLTAHQVVAGYIWRWQIELFFRWLKRQVRLIRVLGYSENAVLLSIWLSLLVHLLLILACPILGRTRPSVVVRDALASALADLDFPLLSFAPT